MLYSQGSTNEHQLTDIITEHVLIYLHIREIIALSGTCTSMRQLIHSGVPAKTWRAVATTSFPLGSPIRSLLPSQIWPEIQRLIHLHVAIHTGAGATVRTIEFSNVNKPVHLASSPSGSQVLALHEEEFVVYALDTQTALRCEEVWRISAPTWPYRDLVHFFDRKCVWAPDESAVAINCHPHDGDINMPWLVELTRQGKVDWHLMHVLNMRSRQIQTLTRTPDYRVRHLIMFLEVPIFSPDSSLLLAPWSRVIGGHELLEVFETHPEEGWKQCGQIEFLSNVAGHSSVFAPDSSCLAVCLKSQIKVYTKNGTLTQTLEFTTSAAQGVVFAAWSPTGSRLAAWCTDPPSIHIFDTSSWMELSVTPLEGFENIGVFMVYGILDLVHVSIAHGRGESHGSLAMCRLHESARESVGPPVFLDLDVWTSHYQRRRAPPTAQPAFTNDGLLMAYVDKDHLFVLHTRTREVVYSHPLHQEEGLGEATESFTSADIAWVPGRSAILVILHYNLLQPLKHHISLYTF